MVGISSLDAFPKGVVGTHKHTVSGGIRKLKNLNYEYELRMYLMRSDCRYLRIHVVSASSGVFILSDC